MSVVTTPTTERRLAAIMVADVAGFSRLMERDESRTFARLRQLRDEVVHRRVGEHAGRVVKTTGDGFLAAFDSAAGAVRCALDIQRDVVAREAGRSADARLRLRIGINVGDIIIDGDDVAGDGVNVAARLEALAPPDGVCISGTVREQIHDDLGVALADLGERKVKNIARPIHAFAITLAASASPTLAAGAAAAREPDDLPSIAVLPFANLGPEAENDYFADGLAEELLNVLAKIRGLRVASRTSAFFFKGKDVDLATVAQRLNVATILEGSVRRSGQRIRITAQLIDAASDSHLWSQAYDHKLDDILAVQVDIANAVVAELRPALLREHGTGNASAGVEAEVQAASSGRSGDAEAYRLYLQGRFYVNRLTETDVERGIEFYRRALERDSRFALAWAGLAWAHRAQAAHGWRAVQEGMEQSRRTAQQALALGPDLAEGHVALGWVLSDYDWDWRGAQAEFERALELAPGDGDVLRACAGLAMQLGRADESIDRARRAVALDPLSKPARVVLGDCHLRAGQLDAAVASLQAALDLGPNSGVTRSLLAHARLLQGRAADALREAEREVIPYLRLLGVALAEHTLGHAAASDAALKQLIGDFGDAAAFQIAGACAWRGETDDAFAWLERAYAARDPGMSESVAYPLLRSLHGDPRWSALMRKMRFS